MTYLFIYTIIVFVFGFSRLEYEVYESDGSVEIEIFFIRGIAEDYQPLVLVSTHNGTATGQIFNTIIYHHST